MNKQSKQKGCKSAFVVNVESREKRNLTDGKKYKDLLLGAESSGAHARNRALARRVFFLFFSNKTFTNYILIFALIFSTKLLQTLRNKIAVSLCP